jgi:hypothetical protein
MSCTSIDLKAYALGELDDRGTREAAAHVHACSACRDELERLRLTHMALLSLRDEEPPRRIAFVSDKIFEPKWWQRIWQSAPAMGFASAALLSCAILVHAYTRPAPVVHTAQAVDAAAIEQRVEARLNERLNAELTRAVADVRRADEQKMTELLAATQKDYQLQRRADLAMLRGDMEMDRKMNSRLYTAAANIEERP